MQKSLVAVTLFMMAGMAYGQSLADVTNDLGRDDEIKGACCFFTKGCLFITEAMCLANGGEYLGDGEVCWPNPCIEGEEPPGPGWNENFDSYDNGTYMHDVGGWTGWFDDPAACGTITNAISHSAPNSMAVNDTSDAIHPLTGFDSGKWIITAWQYIPTGLSGTSYFVVNSHYESGGTCYWTVEMQFDPSTNVVRDQLRDPDGLSTLPIKYDQWVEIRIEVDLSSGMGTISEYYDDELLVSGNWIVGSIGQLNIANIDLYAPHSTVINYDDISIVPNNGGGPTPGVPTRPLFTGVEYGDLPTRTANFDDAPEIVWNNGFIHAVSAAAGLPDGSVYFASGGFSTKLYLAPIEGPEIELCSTQNEISGLAYAKGKLIAFSNYGSPMGLYEVDPATGDMTLLVETGSLRFFALDYNAADDLLYGYSEYGTSGLYSIDPDDGTMTFVADRPSVSNAAGRGMACGDNKVYVVTVYGEEVPMQVYDLAQGPGGVWTEITHPYPESNSTSGAAWTQPLAGDIDLDGDVDLSDLAALLANYGQTEDVSWIDGDLDLDGDVDLADLATLLAVYGYGR